MLRYDPKRKMQKKYGRNCNDGKRPVKAMVLEAPKNPKTRAAYRLLPREA
jgi:hypothetical protein